MPGDKVFKTKDLSAQIGSSRLSFGNEEQMQELLHVHPGSVSPMGLMFDGENRVRLLVDAGLREIEKIAFHPCDNTASTVISNADFLRFLEIWGGEYEWISIED